MSVSYKDYYKILGVPKTASDDEIRKAFRKLARQYHPDVAKDKKGAEEKFKEINEANEVLGDPAKRKKYDELGENWQQGSSFRPPPGWQGNGAGRGQARGRRAGGHDEADFEFQGTGFSDFFEQFFGSSRSRSGHAERSDENGHSQKGGDVEADLMVTLEDASKGAVRTISLRRADGTEEKTNTYKVKIPAGVRAGQRLRVPGQGGPGSGGGEAGDLYLRVHFAGHPEFRVENDTLYHDLDLAPWEAALGANVSIPTLDGTVNIKIPPGTQTGQKLRVRGRGLGNREGVAGDLVVVTRIQSPTELSAEERELWEKLAKQSTFRPRE